MLTLRSILDTPRAMGAPLLSRWDWGLALVFLAAGLAELSQGSHTIYAWMDVALVAILSVSVLGRRVRPFHAVIMGFVAVTGVQVAQFELVEPTAGASIFGGLILLVYALVRWASGREALIGLGLLVVLTAIAEASEWEGSSEFFQGVSLGVMIWACAGTVAVVVRHRSHVGEGRVAQVRGEERKELARELHDTVAHHVSAIAIQAQAARVVAPTRPEAALEALEIIEETASRTMSEMRKIVGALRDAGTTPQRGLADIERLAKRVEDEPRIEVNLKGTLAALDPSVETGLYRIAQESITNARRHARDARCVTVRVDGTDEDVSLTVTDDGRGSPRRSSYGFGLTGLEERTALLGGTFEAGPTPDGGWRVHATLPRTWGRP